MKRTILSAVIALCAVIIFIPAPSGAMSLGVGATTWYAWWQPAWAEGESTGVGPGSFDWEIDPAFMGGPLLILGFPGGFSLSSVMYIGKYESSAALSALGESWHREILKYDIDTTLSYRVTQMISVFAGAKVLGFRFDETMETGFGNMNSESSFDGYGPGIGASITMPVSNSFFISAGLSFLYTLNSYKANDPFGLSLSTDVTGYGCNTTLSLLYNLADYNTVISTGFRYQFITFSQEESVPGFFDYDGRKDHFYGVTVSVIYTFNL
ncbi:MAG: hypothetical protein KBA61_05800 [Spirochaetes bacterium]|nr:hypothetical protein [Spirochaetota bacterium]